MLKLNPDLTYSALAAVAVGGCISPLLFPMATTLKTVNLVSSVAAAGVLAAGHQSGGWERARRRHAVVRESNYEVWLQQQASREALALRQIEANELVETLVMLDELTPVEQRHFLGELGLLELLPLYQDNRVPVMAEPVIEPQAVEVKEPQPEFSGPLEWAVQSVLTQAMQPQPTEGIVDDTFEEVDLGKAIAEMMVSGDVPLCVMLACPPRTGKTTLLTVTIAWLHRLTDGGAKVKIFNGKENRDATTGELKDRFLGLVDDPTRYRAIETNEAGKEFAEEFHDIAANMLKPRQYPEVAFLDEFNNIRARVHGYDQQNGLPKPKSKLNQVDIDSSLLITQGTSRRQFLLITSHSAYVKNIGVDRSIQDGVYSIVLGRGGALDGLYKALKGSTAVVQNATRANQLLTELQQWEQSPIRDHSRVVALSNLINGQFGLYFVKYVDLSKVSFAPICEQPPQPEAEDPYAVWDEQFEDEVGHQPEDDPDWKPPTLTPNNRHEMAKREAEVNRSQQELITALKEWIKTLGKTPGDAELKAKAEEMLRTSLSDKAFRGIKRLLHDAGIQFDEFN